MSPPAVQFAEVSASRGGRTVLRQVSLSVAAGQTVALVGRSGSGKTTLLRLVNRLLDPDSGDVLVDGLSTRAWNPVDLRRRTGYVIQDAGLFPHVTVAGNIATVPRLLEWPSARIEARVDELLTLVGLDPAVFRGRWPDQLSGGQRQRAGLARALAADPPLLLMDEPFGALDPITKGELHAEFQRVQRTLHRSVILVTHDMAEACLLADQIAVLHDGEVIACDTPANVVAANDVRVTSLFGELRLKPEATPRVNP
ncbi:MAG: ABC transporter ATP-binding protein [Acidobacterium sp.]|nr:ATP-binding cassette domain-containing protein [Acidobacteriota bacterium]PHY09736.1 MAG: ABC transporter ATP-binding protein [Acidobacterium sp.]